MTQTITILDNDTIEIRETVENVQTKTRQGLMSTIAMADRQIDGAYQSIAASQATKDDALYWLNKLPAQE